MLFPWLSMMSRIDLWPLRPNLTSEVKLKNLNFHNTITPEGIFHKLSKLKVMQSMQKKISFPLKRFLPHSKRASYGEQWGRYIDLRKLCTTRGRKRVFMQQSLSLSFFNGTLLRSRLLRVRYVLLMIFHRNIENFENITIYN